MLSQRATIFALVGGAITVFGFMISNKESYPVASKFSGIVIIAGVAIASLALATKWNPIA